MLGPGDPFSSLLMKFANTYPMAETPSGSAVYALGGLCKSMCVNTENGTEVCYLIIPILHLSCPMIGKIVSVLL